MSTTHQPSTPTEHVGERTMRAVITTESGSTYRLDGDRLFLDGHDGRSGDAFTLISLDGARIIYTDGEHIYRSSPIATLEMA